MGGVAAVEHSKSLQQLQISVLWNQVDLHTCLTGLQGLLAKDAGQLDELEVSKDLAAFPDAQLVGPDHAALHRPLCEGLPRAVCTISSQLRT